MALLYVSSSSIQTDSVLTAVNRLLELTNHIELSGGCRVEENLLAELLRIKNEKEVSFLVHGYFPPPPEHFILNFADTGSKTRAFISESTRFIDALDAGYCSVHAGFTKNFDLEGELLHESCKKVSYSFDDIKANVSWFKNEFPNLRLALENLYPNNGNNECCFMMHVDDIEAALEALPETYLLLDLGHLKISANLLGFDYLTAAQLLFKKFGDRIIEIHLSENNGNNDDHYPVFSDSLQYRLILSHVELIKENNINITIEARKSTFEELKKSYDLLSEAINR
jgi:sugar phosphate isomerase/epimerase